MTSSFNSLKPLQGRTVVAACSESKLEELAAGLQGLGAKVLPFPVIELRPLEDTRLVDRAIESLHEYEWIIFTSVHGVRFFLQRLRAVAREQQAIPNICAIGPATAKALVESGYTVALVPEKFAAEGIIEALETRVGGLGVLAGCRILIPRAKEGRDLLPNALLAAGALVDVVPCYQNARPDPDENILNQLRTVNPDMFVFTSSSAVRNMIDILGYEDGKRMLLKMVVAVLGPITGSTVESYGKFAEIIPRESTVASLLNEICIYCSRNHSTVDRQQ
jgi:uroporphyrinogen III methyltransferase / synthase